MSFSANVSVNARGPLFTGAARLALDGFTDDWRDAIADTGVAEIVQESWGIFKQPTGAWASGVVHESRVGDSVINDSRSVYGPWLEGTGSRNKTSRFKGYAQFRKKAQDLDRRSVNIGLFELRPWLARMQ